MKFAIIAVILAASMIMPRKSAEAAAKKPLIIYFSWGGNTRSVAERVRSLTGGDVYEIVTANAYPKDYNAATNLARVEQREKLRPALKMPKIPNLSEYDTVIIASPNWWGALPMAVMSMLDANDFSGKKISQIVTHGGGGAQRCESDLRSAEPKAAFTKSFITSGGSTSGLEAWLAECGLKR